MCAEMALLADELRLRGECRGLRAVASCCVHSGGLALGTSRGEELRLIARRALAHCCALESGTADALSLELLRLVDSVGRRCCRDALALDTTRTALEEDLETRDRRSSAATATPADGLLLQAAHAGAALALLVKCATAWCAKACSNEHKSAHTQQLDDATERLALLQKGPAR